MNSLSASIIEQRVLGLMDEIRSQAAEELRLRNDEAKLKSLAFLFLCVRVMLDLPPEEAFDCLVDGAQDFGVDAIYFDEDCTDEVVITIFQAKYRSNPNAGEANFPENSIRLLIDAVRCIFNPSSALPNLNDRLKAKVEEIRSLISNGAIPKVRVIACSNGIKWTDGAQQIIDSFPVGDQLTWEYVNHDVLLKILRRTEPVDTILHMAGEMLVEDMNYRRTCIGRMSVVQIKNLVETYGERLLQKNIRRYLGLHGNRVNEAIRDTLCSDDSDNFYFYNNGLTLTCRQFSYNKYDSKNYMLQVKNLQVVNGGQTCMTIFKVLDNLPESVLFSHNASVLVRIYEVPDEDGIVARITQATNSQNPVDLKDLHANDEQQILLEKSIEELGFSYRRKRAENSLKNTEFTPGIVAEAILSAWHHKPHQAKFFSREHFGKLYKDIFTTTLNGSQAILAVLLYRIAENRRRNPQQADPLFVRYSSCFSTMCMGRYLLADLRLPNSAALDHTNFLQAKNRIETEGISYFQRSLADIENALSQLYRDWQHLSLQQLSATFRRSDLIERLDSESLCPPL